MPTSLKEAPTITVTPNLEVLTPDFAQNGSALNALINFIASNFTTNSKYRKIQIADDSGFTTGLQTIIEGNNSSSIGANFSITRTGDLTSTKTVYVRIAHSSNNLVFGEWSPTKTAIFANSGGSGGSSEGNPPSDLFGTYYFHTSQVRLYWTNNGGTSDNLIYQNGTLINTVSSSTNEYFDAVLVYGNNIFQIQNDDGSSNSWEYWYDGGEL